MGPRPTYIGLGLALLLAPASAQAGVTGVARELWAVVGSDVDSSPFDDDSYCGGYSLNVGLETTQWWLDECSDGFLDCSSQAGAGYEWFQDLEYTKEQEPLSHAQSRRDCFGLDLFLRGDMTP